MGDDAGAVAEEVRAHLEQRVDEMVELLRELVEVESGTDDPEGLDRLADRLERRFGTFGPLVRHRTGPGGASHLVLSLDGAGSATLPHLLILCHYDTVWPRGTLEELPFSVDQEGRARGPGCADMKGGIALVYFALDELRRLGHAPPRSVRVLFSCDEEVRSRTARPLIEVLADNAAAALVPEPPLPGGALKTARKGAAIYRLTVVGLAAHAGIEPEKGTSAVVELARQIEVLDALNDRERGTSVNVGVIRGGTRPNVVAAHAEAEVDVRTTSIDEARRVDQAIDRLRPTLPGALLHVHRDLGRPPMERSPATAALFARARAIASAMGVSDLAEGSTGGASDGNLVAAQGVPTLDGLGPHGGGAHARDEHVWVPTMPHRAALLAGLIVDI
jgi:glutamate carboxypeptidase